MMAGKGKKRRICDALRCRRFKTALCLAMAVMLPAAVPADLSAVLPAATDLSAALPAAPADLSAPLSAVLSDALPQMTVRAYGSQVMEGTDLAALQALPTGDLSIRISPDSLKKISEEESDRINDAMAKASESDPEETLIINRAEHYYYYEQLDATAKVIYDVMMDIARYPAKEENYGFMVTDLDPESEEYYYEMLQAYYAMTYDHPELFWLYGAAETTVNYYSEAKPVGGLYYVYYKLSRPYERYEEQMRAFNAAADDFLADIDTTASDADIVKQVHDKLIEMVYYDSSVSEDLQGKAQNLAHTAYGALVENTEGMAHYAVCDGYSLALEYILQQCGIEAVVMAGDAGPDETGLAGHAWNMVKLEDAWYELDATWDDAGTRDVSLKEDIPGYEYYYEALHDPMYRYKLQHCHFLVSTEEMRQFITSDEYNYQTKDQKYIINLVGNSVHIRFENDGNPDPVNADSSVIALAPVAVKDYTAG